MVTATKIHSIKNKRWRVNNNIAGNKDFAPVIVKTESFKQSVLINIPDLLTEINEQFGIDILMRASTWLTLGESKASFTIEGESKQAKPIERFADFMAHHLGTGSSPLLPDNLASYQKQLLGNTVLTHFGVRKSPVFVGQTRLGQGERVHYIAPPSEYVLKQMNGLQDFFEKTSTQSAVMRSAVIAFGLVYIHPLADGNGRLHRFLFNDVLRRDGVTIDPVILPLSKAIITSTNSLKNYADILDSISKPLMKRLAGCYHFKKERVQYSDGVWSNFVFNGTDEALPVWRFLDLTSHVVYLSQLIHHVITHDMHQESRYLQQHEFARNAINEIISMPNDYIDRIIRSIQNNPNHKSNKLVKEIPQLLDDGLYQAIVKAVNNSFTND